jgi:hypothetical protein
MELPGRCGDWLDTATVTAQGLTLPTTRRTRDADFYLAKNADLHMATTADLFTARDSRLPQRAHQQSENTRRKITSKERGIDRPRSFRDDLRVRVWDRPDLCTKSIL